MFTIYFNYFIIIIFLSFFQVIFAKKAHSCKTSLILSASLGVISAIPAHSAIIAGVESATFVAKGYHSPWSPYFHCLARNLNDKSHSTPKSIPRMISWLISSTALNFNVLGGHRRRSRSVGYLELSLGPQTPLSLGRANFCFLLQRKPIFLPPIPDH